MSLEILYLVGQLDTGREIRAPGRRHAGDIEAGRHLVDVARPAPGRRGQAGTWSTWPGRRLVGQLDTGREIRAPGRRHAGDIEAGRRLVDATAGKAIKALPTLLGKSGVSSPIANLTL